MKTDQKYYIGKNDKITIRCLACKKIRTIAVADLKLKLHSIKVVCPCSHTFFIHLEFRQSYRKKMDIEGSYRKRSESVEQEKSCLIRDISLGGLGITITNDTSIQVEDELIVSFKLGTFQQSGGDAIVRVRHIDSRMNIGGAFVGSTPDNRLEVVTLFLQ
ncbi:MAG: PilZ domain-containing protein [Desulfobulbus sp.]|nr:PilZ domain-containing protein [Desulfobulbus sp.]